MSHTGGLMGNSETETIHPLQRLMDNPWLLLVLGVVIPFVSYTAWGWADLLTLQPATLP
jgi:hypothetical protein